MGYRSDLVVAVHKQLRTECLLENTWPALLSEDEPVKEHNNIQFWEITGIKWYEGFYPEVDEMLRFFSEYSDNVGDLDQSLLGAIRMGEEFGDYEDWGDPSEFEIFVTQEIQY